MTNNFNWDNAKKLMNCFNGCSDCPFHHNGVCQEYENEHGEVNCDDVLFEYLNQEPKYPEYYYSLAIYEDDTYIDPYDLNLERDFDNLEDCLKEMNKVPNSYKCIITKELDDDNGNTKESAILFDNTKEYISKPSTFVLYGDTEVERESIGEFQTLNEAMKVFKELDSESDDAPCLTLMQETLIVKNY